MSIENHKLKLKNQAGNFLYIFIDDKYLKDTSTFGPYTSIIKRKKDLQNEYLKQLIFASGSGATQQKSYDTVKQWLRDAMAETYAPLRNPQTGKMEAASPESILYYLAMGYDIAGKNWRQGVFDDPQVTAEPIVEVGDYTINQETGLFEKNGSASGLVQQPIYNVSETPTGQVCYDPEQNISLSAIETTNGYSIETKTDAGGKTKSTRSGHEILADTKSYLVQINDMMPEVKSFILDIINTVKVQPQQMTPSQTGDGWYKKQSSGSGLLTTASLGLGALLIGGVVLGGSKKKKK